MKSSLLTVTLVLLVSYGFMHQEGGWNQNSRLDLLHAMYAEHRFTIDSLHENTGDKAYFNGHYFSDKPPGIVFLAAPAFFITATVIEAFGIPPRSETGWFILSWITTFLSVGVIGTAGGCAFFLLSCRYSGESIALISTLGMFLGSVPLPYATMLFSHTAVVGLLCCALYCIDGIPGALAKYRLSAGLIAGLCCGFAIASELTSGIAVLGVLLLAAIRDRRKCAGCIIGCIPPAALVMLYNWACFENPFSFGYQSLALAEFEGMNRGFFGISFPPKIDSLYILLLSPERGLLFWSPVVLMAVLGVRFCFRANTELTLIGSSVIVCHVALMGGYYMPDGGEALGPRHLASILPFLGFLVLGGICRFPVLGALLACVSVQLVGAATTVDATPGVSIENPLVNLYLPAIFSGQFTSTIPSVLGVSESTGGYLFLCFLLSVQYLIVKQVQMELESKSPSSPLAG